MGISFKVSKTGKRFQPKPLSSGFVSQEEELEGPGFAASKHDNSSVPRPPRDLGENRGTRDVSGAEVSFTLSLFPDGYSIAKPVEDESSQLPINLPKSLLPYDRASETLFSAIECGRLPADILDDIPGKYVDGALFGIIESALLKGLMKILELFQMIPGLMVI
ncbi:hypothetical protein M569_07115 [Genlisea aurea]|uniref:Uncharacterized protein n=1 Tax=Genlisea aurea TaxID=192259 RepID=S8DWQ7_9LAMI|nr:hypothetical protein M569_07115 [Genlisea aurea]